ncbi:MAG TPA: TonB family protein [Terriglobales bacterium]|nr:TonB family protein [Terriglobales bacterium]
MESAVSHGLMLAAIWSLSHAWLLHPRVTLRPVFEHNQIVYYTTSEYLPPIHAPSPRARAAQKADPAYAPQEIISVPPEADNHSQTIVTPPDVKLAQEMHLPNLVAWTPTPGPVPVPGSLNTKLTLPAVATPVVPPPPEVARATDRRLSPLPQPSVIAPPPDVAQTSDRAGPALPKTSVIAPPPDVADTAHGAGPALPQPKAVAPAPETTSALASLRNPGAPQPAVVPPPARTALVTHPLGPLNVSELQTGVAAPKLPVPAQQTAIATAVGGGSGGNSGRPSLSGASGPSGTGVIGQAAGGAATAGAPDTHTAAFGRPIGQMIALSVAPSAVSGPIEVPQGNRRGTFAAGPSGRIGASGTPAANGGGTAETGSGNATSSLSRLAGISIAPGPSQPANGSAQVVVAAPPARNLLAMASIPTSMRSLPPRPQADLPGIVPSAIERQVFGNKKFYSVTLNMPNLNSRSGSWVIRFAELNEDRSQGELTAPVVTEKVDPAYPGILMREHVTGIVTLYAVIGTDGSVGDVRILRGVDDRLDAAARDALRHCHFRPATKNGTAVPLEAVIRIPFEVNRIPY